MHKTSVFYKTALAICIVFCSCNDSPTEENTGQTDSMAVAKDTTPVNELATFHFTYTIANLPPPLEVLEEFSKSNMAADVSLLNPAENVDNYHTS